MANQAFQFKLVGTEELMKNLEELPTIAMQKTVVRNAIKKALKPVEVIAKQNVPVKTGNLRNSIKVSTSLKASQRKFRDPSVVTVYVGSSAPHAHLVEFGTDERSKKEKDVVNIDGEFAQVQATGKMRPTPFLRNAWDQTKMQILKIFADEMRNQLNKAAARLAKRAATGKLTETQIRGLQDD